MATKTNGNGSPEKTYEHCGYTIRQDVFGAFVVYGRHWGDQPGENCYAFTTLKQAKAFIERHVSEWAA